MKRIIQAAISQTALTGMLTASPTTLPQHPKHRPHTIQVGNTDIDTRQIPGKLGKIANSRKMQSFLNHPLVRRLEAMGELYVTLGGSKLDHPEDRVTHTGEALPLVIAGKIGAVLWQNHATERLLRNVQDASGDTPQERFAQNRFLQKISKPGVHVSHSHIGAWSAILDQREAALAQHLEEIGRTREEIAGRRKTALSALGIAPGPAPAPTSSASSEASGLTPHLMARKTAPGEKIGGGVRYIVRKLLFPRNPLMTRIPNGPHITRDIHLPTKHEAMLNGIFGFISASEPGSLHASEKKFIHEAAQADKVNPNDKRYAIGLLQKHTGELGRHERETALLIRNVQQDALDLAALEDRVKHLNIPPKGKRPAVNDPGTERRFSGWIEESRKPDARGGPQRDF
jgi:hypothetical protein